MGRDTLVIGPDHPQYIANLNRLGITWKRGTFNGLYGIASRAEDTFTRRNEGDVEASQA